MGYKTRADLQADILVLEDKLKAYKNSPKPEKTNCPVLGGEVLKNAKIVGLFKRNKSLKQYEIIVSDNDYENL